MDFPDFYLDHIDNLLTRREKLKEDDNWQELVYDALNGGPSRALRQNISISQLRNNGVFFTNEKISEQISVLIKIGNQKSYYDPACGVGDLLIKCAKQLDVFPNLSETLDSWGDRLYGTDIFSSFIHITKVRLALFALLRGAKYDVKKSIDDYFPNISVGNSLTAVDYPTTDYIVVNPPYSTSVVNSQWAKGKVSQAALFLEKLSEKVENNTVILAILPDVLRSGTRYRKWRALISKRLKIEHLEIVGRFDDQTDVDVFISQFIKTESIEANNWPDENDIFPTGLTLLGNLFDIRVGTVVPHRDPEKGAEFLYITAKDIKSRKSVEPISLRKYFGTTFQPPFVVVKRTSSPTDKYRASAAVITGNQNIAVENHLIVLKPKKDSLEICMKLVDKLQSVEVNNWLNRKIRCRHLTVAILHNLPLWSNGQ